MQALAGMDWPALRDPRNALGSAETFIDRAVADAVAQESQIGASRFCAAGIPERDYNGTNQIPGSARAVSGESS